MYWMLSIEGSPLANFIPRINEITYIRNCVGDKVDTQITGHLDFGESSPGPSFTMPIEEISNFDWRNLDDRCRYYPKAPLNKIKRYLEDAVHTSMENAPRQTTYKLDRLGVHIIEGKVMFCTGQGVILPPDSTMSHSSFQLSSSEQRLMIDKELSEADAISEMLDFLSLSANPARVLLTHKLVYLMRQAYIDAGIEPRICIYLYGQSGTQKTTYSNLLTQMYNCDEGIKSPVRLNASIPSAIKILLQTSDDVVVLDDLYPADFKQVRNQQEETLIEITRYIGDGIMPARMRGNKLSTNRPKCGVVFTGEYIIGSGSDAARLLPVEMMKPDGEKLKHFQDFPLIIPTFYYYYISWFISHYKEIIECLKSFLDCYRKDNSPIHDRLRDTHFFLNTAYVLLLQYCYEQNLLSEQDVHRLHQSFLDLLSMLVQEQNERTQTNITKDTVSKSSDYLALIRSLYRNGDFLIADSKASFRKELHDGVRHKDCLCLRGEKLESYLNAKASDIADELVQQGVLEVGKGSRSKQISGLNGLRFYFIPFKCL